jgi:hypothetical protein
MSDFLQLQDTPASSLSATSLSSLKPPPWASEAFLLAHLWVSSGLLAKLSRILVPRARFGRYEAPDFALLLLAYAASREPTLKDFFRSLPPIKGALAAVWQRVSLPVASALSRFLAAVPESACDALRALMREDLLVHGVPLSHQGGLYDRRGVRQLLFDVDGTRQVARQRALPQGPDRPAPTRRLRRLCAPGYTGRKRGELVRTRSTVQQAHTHEWLGTFGTAGNGDAYSDLARVCETISDYLETRGFAASQGVLRLDGLYGHPAALREIGGHGLGYVLRAAEHRLLFHAKVKRYLQRATPLRYESPESPTVREVFDIPSLVWRTRNAPTKPVSTRLIVTCRASSEEEKEAGQAKVGLLLEQKVYELFVTDRPPEALTACDILSLYWGRGGFEQTFSEEDREQDPDRWCSASPWGQEFWQLICQWVWNARIRLGMAALQPEVRRTLWSPPEPEVVAAPAPQPPPSISPEAPKAPEIAEPERAVTTSTATPDRIRRDAFEPVGEGVLRCPAGKELQRISVQRRRAELYETYQARAEDCGACAFESRCLSRGGARPRGRRVSISKPIPRRAVRAVPPIPVMEPGDEEEQGPPAVPQKGTRVYWEDLESRRLRVTLTSALRQQGVEVWEEAEAPPTPAPAKVWTRDERAHRRLKWEERRARNARGPHPPRWHLRLYGIPVGVLEYLARLSASAAAA